MINRYKLRLEGYRLVLASFELPAVRAMVARSPEMLAAIAELKTDVEALEETLAIARARTKPRPPKPAHQLRHDPKRLRHRLTGLRRESKRLR